VQLRKKSREDFMALITIKATINLRKCKNFYSVLKIKTVACIHGERNYHMEKAVI